MIERRNLPLSALRAFESAGRHLSLAKAGDALGVTHSAISHQIRVLEDFLGLKLFSRSQNRLRLTSAGEQLLDAVTVGFDLITEAAAKLDPETLTGILTIGVTQTFGASWAIEKIGEFQGKYPEIDIRFVELKPRQKSVPRGVDVAICYGQPKIDNRKIKHLITAPVYPVASPKLFHSRKPVRRAEQVANLPLLHDRQNVWSRWFEEMGVSTIPKTQQVYFDNTSLCLSAARSGYGVALCNLFEIQEDLREGRLMKLLDKPIAETHGYYLVSDESGKQLQRARLFEAWLMDVVRDYGF